MRYAHNKIGVTSAWKVGAGIGVETLDLRLSEELVLFQQLVRRFVDRELIPLEGRSLVDGELDPDLHTELSAKARAAGLWNLDVPEACGGQGLGLLAMSIFWEETGRTTALPSRDLTIFGPMVGPILTGLKGELAERYLFPTLRGEKSPCFAQTEPDAGSDPAGMRTRARRDGDVYVVNGTKRFITGGHKADYAQVMVVTDPARGARGGISCLLVDMNLPGVSIPRRDRTMMGDRPSEIVFEDVRVPAANLVGEEGGGFRLGQGWITHGRIRHGARSCGVAERCLDMTARYVGARKTFGTPLADRQSVQWMLADSFTELHAARLMVRSAAWRADAGDEMRAESFMVKLYGDEMGFRVVDRCMQLHGGLGLTTDLPLEKFWRDQRSFLITEGPSEVMRMAIAREVFKHYS